MIEKLVEQVEVRFAELERQMSDPQVIAGYLGSDSTTIDRSGVIA